MSNCTSWWHSFDRSAYGIIESNDFIVGTVFPSYHRSVQSHACLTQQKQFDQWLDYKSCWQISSRRCWYFYISATTRLWPNAFRTWRDFSSSFCCIYVCEFSWYIISVDVNSGWNISWELPCWFWLPFAPNLVITQYWNYMHGLCRQMHWIPGLPLLHHVGRVSPSCTVWGNECIIPDQQGRITLSCIPSWYAWSIGFPLIQHAQTGGWEEWVGGSCILSEDLWGVLRQYPGIRLLVQMNLVPFKGTFSDVMMQHCYLNLNLPSH